MESAALGAFGFAIALGLHAPGCGKKETHDEPQPAPSQSAVSIVNAFGACDDLPLCEKECDAGAGDRCRRLGVTYQFGNGAPKDEKRATEYFETACKLGNAPACLSAGQMFEYHHGVEKDDARAAAFYKQACDLGYSPGCANFAIMLENGRGVPKDEARAATLYEKACREGAGLACDRLKAMHAPSGDR